MPAKTFVAGLACLRCGREYAARGLRYLCACGGNLEVRYDFAAARKAVGRRALAADRDPTIWRYQALLPVRRPRGPLLAVGGTPLIDAARLGRELGVPKLQVKDDGRNPSASFKDRAGVIAVADALRRRRKVITGASTGNAASSLACLAANLPLRPVVFVPASAPPAKVTQLLVFGATVLAVDGTYDDAFDLCRAAADDHGWYNRNTGYNPYTREGKKTCAFEIAEQRGFRVPDVVAVSVGDGNILSGLWKGFRDLRDAGLTARLPRLLAVQARGSNAIARAFRRGGGVEPVGGETVADSISVSLPRDADGALRALRDGGGLAVEVTDEQILAAIPRLARAEGVFAEPAGAAAVAGVAAAREAGLLTARDEVVAVVTGNGLKDVAGARKAVGAPHLVSREPAALRRLIRRLRID